MSLSTNFGRRFNPMFDDPPKCFLHRQGNFITKGFMAEKAGANPTRVGVFQLPGVSATDKPVLGGGDLPVPSKTTTTSRRPWSS